jgi:hypothetical protein
VKSRHVKTGKAKMKNEKSKSKPTVAQTLHKLRTNALRALKIDPFNKDVLKQVITTKKAPAGRANVVTLAKAA